MNAEGEEILEVSCKSCVGSARSGARNLALEAKYWEGNQEPPVGLTTELVQLSVDVIVARATPRALAAKQVTKFTDCSQLPRLPDS
jgi:hypothetical protein